MEVRQLQIFRILAEELNFTRTAEKVNTVQSNVTAQIKALEEELGTPLFDRLGRRVVLTDAGQRFRPFAEQALAAMEQGLRAIRSGNDPSGPLRISAPESQLTYRLPPVLHAFRTRFPNVELRFRPEFYLAPAGDLDSGKVDIVIYMSEAPGNETHRPIRLHTEKISLYAESRHPLVNRRAVKPIDLSGQRLLLTEAGCGYRARLERILATQNIRPSNITEFSSVEAIKQCASAGMGIALLPDIITAREVRERQLKALDWAGPSLDVGTFVIHHKNKWVSPAMAGFLELLKATPKDLPLAVNE
jgi:DNA-binding transcriptional LysR family regulator